MTTSKTGWAEFFLGRLLHRHLAHQPCPKTFQYIVCCSKSPFTLLEFEHDGSSPNGAFGHSLKAHM